MFSAPTLLVAPAAEPITLDQARDYLRADGNALDEEIGMLLVAARTEVEQATGQRLVAQTVQVLADSFADLAHIDVGPVNQVLAIRYQDRAGAEQLLDPTAYELFGAGIDRGVRPVAGTVWPQPRDADQVIAVDLAIGYPDVASVPQKLRFAVFAVLRARFEGRDPSIDALIVNERINP